jgi:hypothetical protein
MNIQRPRFTLPALRTTASETITKPNEEPRITGILDIVWRLVLYNLNNTTFRELDLFPQRCNF